MRQDESPSRCPKVPFRELKRRRACSECCYNKDEGDIVSLQALAIDGNFYVDEREREREREGAGEDFRAKNSAVVVRIPQSVRASLPATQSTAVKDAA